MPEKGFSPNSIGEPKTNGEGTPGDSASSFKRRLFGGVEHKEVSQKPPYSEKRPPNSPLKGCQKYLRGIGGKNLPPGGALYF